MRRNRDADLFASDPEPSIKLEMPSRTEQREIPFRKAADAEPPKVRHHDALGPM
jgi:hypothetical protein